MKKIFQFLISHNWAIVLAIVIGLIMVLPQAYFRYENRDAYQGIELNMKGSDELFYLARIQEVKDGHWSLANPFWKEGKDLSYLQPAGSEILAAWFGQIFGLNLANTVLLERFVFPAVIFLFVYALVFLLSKRKIISLLASATVLLSTELLSPAALWNLLIHQKADEHFLPFSHLISPQTHLLFFFGFLLFFWLFLDKEKTIYGIISSIVFGLSFYTYPYTWTFLGAFLGVLLIIFLWQKNWLWLKRIIWLFLGAGIMALPFFWNLWQAIRFPTYSEVSIRFGLIEGRQPSLGIIMAVLLFIFLLFFARQPLKRFIFCLALVLAPLIVLNQQLITGRSIIPAHYHWYFHRPLFIIILLIIIFEWLAKIKNYPLKNSLVFGLSILILSINFYNAWLVQVNSYLAQEPMALENQRYGPLFKWLNNNGKLDEVAMANPEISLLLPIYSSLNPLVHADAHFSLIADGKELAERIFLPYRFNGLKAEDTLAIFTRDRAKISAGIYGQHYRKETGSYGQIPEEKLSWLAEQYKQSLNTPLEDVLRKREAQYLIWDNLKDPLWSVDKYDFLEQSYQEAGIKIFLLK